MIIITFIQHLGMKCRKSKEATRQPNAAATRQSKAVLTMSIQTHNCEVQNKIVSLCDNVESLLDVVFPSKSQRKLLFDTVNSLLQLYSEVARNIPKLTPEVTTQYSIARLQVAENHTTKMKSLKKTPREVMRL